MPIKVVLTQTTLRAVVGAALKDSQQHRGEPLCLHVSDGGELVFYAPANTPPADGALIRRTLATAVATEMSQVKLLSRLSVGTAMTYADALLDCVLGDAPVTDLSQLVLLCKEADQLRNVGDIGEETTPFMRQLILAVRGKTSASSELSKLASGNQRKAALSDLRFLKPAKEAWDVISLAASVPSAQAEAGRPDVNAQEVVETLVIYANAPTPVPDALEMLRRRIAKNPAICHAVLDQWFDSFERPHAKPYVASKNFCEVLTRMIPKEVFKRIYLGQADFRRFESLGDVLHGDARRDFRERVAVLRSNSERYEAFRQSDMGKIPALEHISREFLVEMFERWRGEFRPSRATDRTSLMEFAHRTRPGELSYVERAAASAGCAPCLSDLGPSRSATQLLFQTRSGHFQAWVLQHLLNDLSEADDMAEPDEWVRAHEIADGLGIVGSRQVFVDEATVLKFEQVVHKETCGRLTPQNAEMLSTLKLNARRMEAFLASDLASDENFLDVDRSIVVPWWEVMKQPARRMDASPQQVQQERADAAEVEKKWVPQTQDGAVVLHMARAADALQTQAQATPRMSVAQEGKGSPLMAIRSLQVPVQLSVPVQTSGNIPVATREKGRDKRGKPEKAAVHATHPVQGSVTAVPNGPVAGKRAIAPSLNVLRTDRPATGREFQNFVDDSDHHIRWQARHIGGREKWRLHEQAFKRALREARRASW